MGTVLAFEEKDTGDKLSHPHPDEDDSVEWDLDVPSPSDDETDAEGADTLDDALDGFPGAGHGGLFGPADD